MCDCLACVLVCLVVWFYCLLAVLLRFGYLVQLVWVVSLVCFVVLVN